MLLGAEVNSEAERSRELRAGLPAEIHLVAPTSSGAAVAGAAPVRARDDRAHAEGGASVGAGALVLTGILAIALWSAAGAARPRLGQAERRARDLTGDLRILL